MRKLIVIFLFFASIILLKAQIKPVSAVYLKGITSEIPIYNISKTKVEQLKKEHSENHLKHLIAGYNFDLSLTPYNSGVWMDKGGIDVWCLGIHSEDAMALSIEISEAELSPGTQIYIYGKKRNKVYGPFTRWDIKMNRKYTLPVIEDDILYIEYHVPKHQLLGTFKISSVCHDIKASKGDSYFGTSGSCNLDINCSSDENIQTTKNAVVRLRIKHDDITIKCSGSLINNSQNDAKPYMLTAYHCIRNTSDAEGTIVYLNYESPYCGGPEGESTVMLGTEYVAAIENLDFSLVKLPALPGFGVSPYLAGWTISESSGVDLYSIHHPVGDVKKISFTSGNLNTTSYNEPGYDFDNNSHWFIEHWNEGVTEPGSSGCPLFNDDDRIIGTLSGGYANCFNPNSDFYQKFSVAWNKYPDSTNQLKHWLDPENEGYYAIDGFDPYYEVKASGDTLSNVDPKENVYSFSLNPWGYLTGHSHLGGTQFAEHFYSDEPNLIFGFNLDVSKAVLINDKGKVKIKVWDGENQPGDILYEKEYAIDYFLSDNNSFIVLDGPVAVDKDFYIGYEIEYNQICDTFAVYHSSIGKPTETTWVYSNSYWFNMYDYSEGYNVSMSIQPILYKSIPKDVYPDITDVDEIFIVYRNEQTGHYEIRFPRFYSRNLLGRVYDIKGVLMETFTIYENQTIYTLDTDNYMYGVYFISIYISGEWQAQKVVIKGR